MLPQWNSNFSVNHSIIDEQHKRLFKLASQVYTLDANAATKHRISLLMREFYDYMKSHFKDEEEYMKTIGYPKLDEHKRQHEEIVESLNKTIKEASSFKQIRISLKEIVKKWLVEHILKHDLEYERWRKKERKSRANLQKNTEFKSLS
ncbi:MAG: hemerythrin family protein [Sulfurospirillaceae bacterium]|nr:hemerythrin family protein [Sulfurospirillaceae bacterium]MCK9545123.1 hemerythrin family protein [Sulfurospirillaceae bacterium]NLM99655.1 hemerythrin family protein [Campylobacteraceae bacterium]